MKTFKMYQNRLKRLEFEKRYHDRPKSGKPIFSSAGSMSDGELNVNSKITFVYLSMVLQLCRVLDVARPDSQGHSTCT